MQKITKTTVFAEHYRKNQQGDLVQRRKCFGQSAGLNEEKRHFSAYIPSVKNIFEEDTGIALFPSCFSGHWKQNLTAEELDMIKQWEKRRGGLVFLRDCLFLSLALGVNFEGKAGNYTELGAWEHEAKTKRDGAAIRNLAEAAAQAIQDLPFYKDADYICAVPPAPQKEFDLPSAIAAALECQIGKPDITRYFHFARDKESVKEASLEKKWDIWETAGLSFWAGIKGKTVILLDDKYQAGITLQYVAMKLQEAGARAVYGLCLVKICGDEDNQRR